MTMEISPEDLISARLPAGPYRTDKQLLLPAPHKGMAPAYHYVLPELARLQRQSLLQALASALKFPAYFGNNWDAASDCLTDRDWPTGAVVIIEMIIAEDALVDEAALTALIDVMVDGAAYWHGQQVALYFLVRSRREEPPVLRSLPRLRLADPAGRDLEVLLQSMEPVRNPGVYVFVSVTDPALLAEVEVFATVRETEGLSAVLREEDGVALGLPLLFRAAWLTLTVQSDLQAVGLTAAFATALGAAGISCNVVAGAWHDHIFVPHDRGDDALAVLRHLHKTGQG